MRDAIIISGWTWETCNVPERLALAFAQLGGRVLYCENSVSRIKHKPSEIREISPRIYRLRPTFWGQRFNTFRLLAYLQSRMVADQIEHTANELGLSKPLLIYPYLGQFFPLCREMERRGYTLVHICIDHPQPQLMEHVSHASHTFVIPRTTFHQLRSKFGDRIVYLPQIGPPSTNKDGGVREEMEPAELRVISRPRLIYLGTLQARIHQRLLREFLATRPDWSFIYFGAGNELRMPNAHALPWMKQDDLARVVAASDVGFMPYDCGNEHAFHSVPLKLLDYFAVGMPVVSTPIISLWKHSDLVYFGDTARELIDAVEHALTETPDSPKRARRIQIAQQHSLEKTAAILKKILQSDV